MRAGEHKLLVTVSGLPAGELNELISSVTACSPQEIQNLETRARLETALVQLLTVEFEKISQADCTVHDPIVSAVKIRTRR